MLVGARFSLGGLPQKRKDPTGTECLIAFANDLWPTRTLGQLVKEPPDGRTLGVQHYSIGNHHKVHGDDDEEGKPPHPSS